MVFFPGKKMLYVGGGIPSFRPPIWIRHFSRQRYSSRTASSQTAEVILNCQDQTWDECSTSRLKQESRAIAKMTARCADKSKQTDTPPPKIVCFSTDSIQPDVGGYLLTSFQREFIILDLTLVQIVLLNHYTIGPIIYTSHRDSRL